MKKSEPGWLDEVDAGRARSVLDPCDRHRRLAAGLATKAIGQGVVNQCADSGPSRTAGCAAKQATEGRIGDDTDGSGCGLRTTSTYDERGVTSWARQSHMCVVSLPPFLPPPSATR